MDWITFVSSLGLSGIVGGLVSYGIQSYLKSGINHHYNKKIADYKDDIAKISDYRQHDFARRLHDFTLYTNKRHEIYPKIYSKISNIVLSLDIMIKLRRQPRMNKIDLENTLKTFNLVDVEHVDEILKKFHDEEVPTKDAFKDISYYLGIKFRQFQNIKLENELYLSDNITDSLENLVEMIKEIDLDLSRYRVRGDNEISLEQVNELNEKVEELKNEMKNELAVSDYEELSP
ncbi:hypothetical protein GLW05_06540 [Pontibacillus yanchengensis]|uniref:Uncharacterized protein n=1 Tax=Pontibacillus yanchengensis TaxID=462910 RepID=A0A6I4ZY42_9BACI|nr:hypothetical protein [Pontibacillus yanchengensis]MYL33257.1 hypothetical protein [Pontibacillus yanchengensis]